ncbi:MAG: outer membrane lipoprotein-sorting protein [Gammaproteobacteria bacterium]|nr:outer membrane lipoprotein-sorting protein [Gammaproteobacteria bacterium]NKB65205.1 outer membrane lipoprotein-sorting protein [Gammaproteobacteria bacterium]
MKSIITYATALVVGVLPFHAALSQSAEEKGLEIATATNQRDSGWSHVTADMEMILKNRAGKESRRKISFRQLEVHGDGDKSLSLFLEPKDVTGTAMLTFSHGLEPDDQWLYLPAIKRVKRISSKNKSGPFMGSEFAFEDLGSQEVEKFAYRFIKEEACGEGFQCNVIERLPQYKSSGYKRQIAWIDKEHYRTIKIEYYDRKDSLLKTLDFIGYNEYVGNFWRADRFEMVNHQTGKSTSLLWTNYDFESVLDDSDFNQKALKRLL